jgi:hypothetical protein
MATSTIKSLLDINGDPSNWNYRENFVQEDEGQGTAGMFIAAESTLICAGPATISDQLSVIKIGLSPSIQISQNIPQQRIYEIGSVRCHIVNGIPVGGLTISRMIYNGPSLLRAIYGTLYDANGNLTPLGSQGLGGSSLANATNLANAWANIANSPDQVMVNDNNTQLWLSCWDQRLKLPFGLAIYMQDVAGNDVGGCYYEGCKVNSSQYGQSSGQMVMMEGISVAFDRAVPIVHGLGSQY